MPVRVVIRDPASLTTPTPDSPFANRSINSKDPTNAISIRTSFRRRTQDLVRRYSVNHIAAQDVSASDRLSGYLFVFTSYVVLLISSASSRALEEQEIQGIERDYQLSEWKLECTFWGSATFVGLSGMIIAVHFDTVFLLRVWRALFKDGSRWELALCSLLVLGSAFMVYLVTSRDGLGGFMLNNSNAYFSSWLGFFACVHTLQTSWCKGPDRQSLEHWLRSNRRETNFYWVHLLSYSTITLLSVLDVFLTGPYDIQWIMIISSIVVVGCCILALMMNMACTTFVSWYKLEGLIIFALSGYWSWVVFTVTGVNGLVHGPSNAYFGIWGSFFYAISTFGAWLKEHRLLIVT